MLQLVRYSKSSKPCIVIIDEIDALKQYKGDKTNQDASPANTLCNLLDDAEDHPNIVFIATTNKLKQLPEDLKSRFGSIITLPLPDECARERIIRYHLEQLEKTGIHVEIDDKTIKSLAAKTKDFSARDLKAMIIKGKISARNIRSNSLEKAADRIISKDVWQAFKEQKPLIAAGWHVKERIKELFDNHGVALTTFAVSTALTVLGIIISERRSVQSMDQSKKQFNEQIERQKEEKRKAKRDKLIKEYIEQEKLLEGHKLSVTREQYLKDPKVVDDYYYDALHIIMTLSILKSKLAKNIAEPESKDRKFFKLRAHFFKQDLEQLEKKGKHDFYVEKYCKDEEGKKLLEEFHKSIRTTFGVDEQGVQAFIDNMFNCATYKKIDEHLILAKSNKAAAEVNEANQRSQAAAREREESDTWRSRIKNFVGAVAAGVATSGLIKWLGWNKTAA